MNLEKFGPFTIYWKEADILGPAKVTFNASSFNVFGNESNDNLLEINNNLLEATNFFLSKKNELLLTPPIDIV